MLPTPRRFVALLATLLLTLLLASPPTLVQADSRQDHDVARKALAAGEILPLRSVLAKIEQAQPGEVLEVELEREAGQWRYEVKLLHPNGGVQKLLIDARDGRILERKGRP